MGRGPQKKYAPNNPRQVPPLNHKKNQLLHLYLHHPSPPPSNPTNHTTPSSNCHPLTPTRTLPQKISPTLSNPTAKVPISGPVPAPEPDQDAFPSITEPLVNSVSGALSGQTETRPSCQQKKKHQIGRRGKIS